MSLEENIKRRRKALKLSQEYVADRLGLSRQAVSKWETGESVPSARHLAELAQLLETSVSDLTREEPPAERSQLPDRWTAAFIGAYSGMVVLSGVQTDDRFFLLYVSLVTLIPAGLMVWSLTRLPAQRRLSAALWELAYCITVVAIMRLLTPVIGNVLAGLLVMVCCLLYVRLIRLKN